MDRKRAAPADEVPKYYATPRYVQWVRDQLKSKANPNGYTLASLAAAMKRVDPNGAASSGGLSQFLGPTGSPPVGSNTTMMPTLNKVLKVAPPPLCDPSDPLAQLRDRFLARWSRLTERERKLIAAMLEDDDPV